MKSVIVHYTLILSLFVSSAFAGPEAKWPDPKPPSGPITPSSLVDASAAEQNRIIQEYDPYLQKLGLDNYSAKAYLTLANESLESQEKMVLQGNIQHYQIVNQARNLITFIMARAIPQMANTQSLGHSRAEDIQHKLVKLTGQLLEFRPLEGFSQAPAEIESISANPNGVEQKKPGELKKSMLMRQANIAAIDNANFSKNQIVVNIMDTLYGSERIETILTSGSVEEKSLLQLEIYQLENLVREYVYEVYENKQLGTTRWLGKGLIYSLVRFSRLQNEAGAFGANTEAMLASHLRETYAENLNNYIKAQITTVDAQNNKINIKIETGDILNESSKNGKDSIAKASAVFPKFFKNPGAYIRMIFKGMWVSPHLYFLTTDTGEIKDKIEAGQKITVTDRIKHAYDQTKRVLANSFTSTAQAIVREVEIIPGKPESKVEAIMVVEFNQNKSVGGVRWIGLEGYGLMNPKHASFAVTKFDYAKMQAEGKKQLSTQKTPFILWEGDQYTWSEKEEKFQKVGNEKTYLNIDEKDQLELKEMLNNMSAANYKRNYQERLVKVWQNWTYGKEAKGYALNYIDTAKAFYSSLGVRLAIRMAGFTEASLESRFSLLHSLLKKGSYDKVQQLNFEKPMTAPNFAAINTSLVKDSSIFHEDGSTKFLQPGWDSNEFETGMANLLPKRESFNPRLDRILSSMFQRNFSISKAYDQFPNRSEAYVEQYQYGNAIRTVKGIKFRQRSMYATDGDKVAARVTPNNDARTLLEKNGISPESQTNVNRDNGWENEIREFLFDYGFDDKAARVRLEIKKQPTPENAEARIQQIENVRNLDGSNNVARELAILFFSKVRNRLNDKTQLNLINDLVAKTLALQPKGEDLLLSSEQKAELDKMPEETEEELEKKLEVKKRYLEPALKRSIEETTRILTSEFLGVMYGDHVEYYLDSKNDARDINDPARREARKKIQADAKLLFGLLAQYTDRMYLDTQTGSTRWLGRAMLYSLARLGEQAQPDVHFLKTKPILNLQKHLEMRSLDVEMFMGDKVVVLDANKQYKKIKVTSGDSAGYIAANAEAGAIASGSQPGDTARAKKLGLIGSIWESITYVDEGKIIKNGYSWTDRLWKNSNRGGIGSLLFNRERTGISHIGSFILLGPGEANINQLKTNSKIQVVFVIDNYPNPVADSMDSMVRPGGARFIGPETFNDSAHESHITVAQNNHVKMGKMLLEELNKQISAGTYVKQKGDIVFPAYKVVLDEKGDIQLPPKNKDGSFVEPNDGWRMESDPAEVINKKNEIEAKLKSARSEAEKSKIYSEFSFWLEGRVTAQLYRMIDKGVFFKWVTPHGAYYVDSSYCTQLRIMAALVANGINIELIPSKKSGLMRFLTVLGKNAEKYQNTAPKFVRKYLKSFLGIGGVDTALKVDKLSKTFAPSNMFAQPYVDDSGVHHARLVSSGLANLLKTTRNEIFIRVPSILAAVNKLLDPRVFIAAKTIGRLDLIGVAEHYHHIQDTIKADTGQKNEEEQRKLNEARRKTIPKVDFLKQPPNQQQKTCPAVFKTAG
ncbi:MAG: hypothetical protein AABY64_05910 [Bdellovibrionota bacterium]